MTPLEKLELLKEVIEIINPRERPTADRQRQLNGRLKDYSSVEVKAAARAFSRSVWHKENGQMSVDNLIRPSKFGRWFTAITPEDMETAPADQDEAVRKRMTL